MNSRTAQFINDRLLLERKETEYGTVMYYLSVVKLEISLPLTKQELDEINKVIANDFGIPKKESVTFDDDIPF